MLFRSELVESEKGEILARYKPLAQGEVLDENNYAKHLIHAYIVGNVQVMNSSKKAEKAGLLLIKMIFTKPRIFLKALLILIANKIKA